MKNKLLVGAALIAIFIGVMYQNYGQQDVSEASAEIAQNIEPSALDSALEQEINSILSELYPSDGPGVAVILVKGDEVIYRNGFGLADIEHNISISPDMVFRLGSLTKQMTAAGIMMLKEAGELQIDDPITRFFPDYPTHGYTITVRHLLTHTSGIIDFPSIEEFPEYTKEELTALDVIDFFKNQPMNFAPGESYSYTNSGYVLLGAIIEQISGQSYEAFIQERIFTPLDMTNSYHGNFKNIIPNRVAGYSLGEEGLENSDYLSMTLPGAAGALISNVDDLFKWNTALFGGDLISQESLEEMTTPFVLNNGELSNYGFGLSVQTLRGQALIAHTGGINGFQTYSAYLPETETYVAVLGNTEFQFRVYEGNSMLALAIGDPYPTKEFQAIDSEIVNSYAGVYQTIRGLSFEVSVIDDTLNLSINGGAAFGLGAVSDNVFYLKDSFTHIEFVNADDASGYDLVFYTSEEGSDAMLARLID
ncbi:beta-lactamase family protein [Haliea sp. AH-315-K21]|uniref:Serine hydrolase n=1 Tax=SAR86 cluster bacterium TaxID=2030880 RepID=A0A2A5CHD3_9GAMM|nr:beta-lactamase family protein [Haliea sp. AH-315-K21]PCJ42901.1 MAG: serine hydrolase [SAR86 cluster bacterium]